MKSLIVLVTGARNVLRLLGGKGVLWVSMGMVSSLVLAGTEYLIAVLMVVFLVALHLMSTAQVPHWFPFDVSGVSAMGVWSCMILVGLIRALCLLVSNQTCNVVLEFVRIRLKMVLGYKMLMTNRASPPAMSEIDLLLGEIMSKGADFVYSSADLVSALTQAAAITAGMFYLAWREAIVGIACLCVAGLTVSRLNRHVAALSRTIPVQGARFGRTVVRITRNWLLIRVLQMQEKEYRNYLASSLAYYRLSVRAFFYRNLAASLPPPLGLLAMAIIIYANLWYFKTPPVELVGFIYLFIRFTQTAVHVTNRLGVMSHSWYQFGESVKLFDSLSPEELSNALRAEYALRMVEGVGASKEEEGAPAEKGASSSFVPEDSPPDIQVRGITLSWPGAPAPLFEDLDIKIPAGAQFGIIGPNGCGKTTLLGIILGVLKPSAGYVLIGGMKSEDYLKKRYSIGYVGADPHLLHGTVRENLLYGVDRTVSDDEMWSVLGMVGLDTLIAGVEKGLEYVIQENGEGLSAGEKQRLALARAFLRRPSLLILDEASANLDAEVESEIADLLGELRGRCTIIIVSHKPGILKGVDAMLDLGARVRNGN